ncbi:hypothetical protein KL905_002311 [Ogataea polymorpha]|uniref:Dol-P-Man:Man(5)GlcNAc(2)-PP-Dol alpha-1,3-mannosyltransferase n=1 Tax=Ogataea polymorpha TaxID=460523 RepID=A0A1B7SCW9_9ASCO|nr:Dol-P-Man dependent alpha-1,3-mannosyltransferase [Ogataea polymorpha]KAG7893561.1 hypothetical protein KL908_002615 [Ogataea polymorpha]KAG7909438.1 hypothetical protein KL906_002194 [Ogataea polymorpha]KAG7922289.1 hypothetical protein KL905_002311 [Ogataea polymorpha]KAG7936482.1 hypothetical protein KL934_001949 [Ogataea polymorpha]KAH3676918.1 hypothetical protein OGATHE_001408 [Ogataea polymorpha]
MADANADIQPETRPELNLGNVLGDIKFGLLSLFNNPEFCAPIAVFLTIAESLLLKAVIHFVPYTEIDYSTYMQQIDQIEAGELDYAKISGDTGPIVYPGGHVYIYSWMKWFTNGMDNVHAGQQIFRYLYLATFVLTLVAYFQTNVRFKPYLLYFLCLSKRLHSIYVLRLFNDCFATFLMVATIVVLQQAAVLRRRKSALGAVLTFFSAHLFSSAVSVKMNALLYLPGYLVVVYMILGENLLHTLAVIGFGCAVQAGINWDFLAASETTRAHFLQNAFDFSRAFLYRWTVNWKFVPEPIFRSREFHTLLLLAHTAALTFFAVYKWSSKSVTGKPSTKFIRDALIFYKDTIGPENVILSPESGRYIFWVMATSNLIGVLFARSLHYQFLAWYMYSLPMLLQLGGLPWYAQTALVVVHEWCWNVYPSTAASSLGLVAVLATVVLSQLRCGFGKPKQE